MSNLSLGERRVRIDFNVGGDSTVDQIKRKVAELINLLEDQRKVEEKNPQYAGEKQRLISIAQTEIERACSDCVKAVTT